MPSPLQHTLKHLLGALVIVGLFGLLIAPSFNVQSLTSLLYPWQSRSTTGGPAQVRGVACLFFVWLTHYYRELVASWTRQSQTLQSIVAIHGLDGHRQESWKAKNGVLWLRDLLPKKIPDARILSYGYDANTRGHEQLSVETLDGHAIALVSKLALIREETSVCKDPTSPTTVHTQTLTD